MSRSATHMPLAILGGTFDPVHIGHLRVALEAADALAAELRLMPASVPPHRAQPVATAAQRVAILKAALAGQDRLRLDERELSRPGRSYTIDTLIELRQEIGHDRSLILLLGRDAFCGLPSWHRWRELFQHAHIGVLGRPGHTMSMPDELANELAPRWITLPTVVDHGAFGKVFEIAVSALEISATAIRELLRRGGDPRYLLPDAVVDDASLLMPYSSNRAGDAING
ncbi:MAG: nicotinate-nucleotide adenylyltransferase [Dokdonella sp.]